MSITSRAIRSILSRTKPYSQSMAVEAANVTRNALSDPIHSRGVSSYSTSRQGFAPTGSISNRIFAPYSVYKGKAALSLTPILPTFTKVPVLLNGNPIIPCSTLCSEPSNNDIRKTIPLDHMAGDTFENFETSLESGSGLKVDRRGSMMLKFLPAIGERKYDWEKRQLFALSPTEIGSVISLGPKDSCEFYHDPSMQSSNAGQVRKSLSIKAHSDGSGYFISLSVANNILKTNERITVPVTTAEFAVMKTACSFALPHIIGWDRYTNMMSQRGVDESTLKVNPQVLDLEWDK